MELKAEQIVDILDKMDFFQGQRAGRELWNDKPFDVQEQDIANFSRDVALLKDYINELTEENERLRADNAKYEAEHHAQFDKWLKLEEATKRHHAELFEEAKIAVKEDTVREMFSQISKHATNGYPRKVRLDVVEKIAKELWRKNENI